MHPRQGRKLPSKGCGLLNCSFRLRSSPYILSSGEACWRLKRGRLGTAQSNRSIAPTLFPDGGVIGLESSPPISCRERNAPPRTSSHEPFCKT